MNVMYMRQFKKVATSIDRPNPPCGRIDQSTTAHPQTPNTHTPHAQPAAAPSLAPPLAPPTGPYASAKAVAILAAATGSWAVLRAPEVRTWFEDLRPLHARYLPLSRHQLLILGAWLMNKIAVRGACRAVPFACVHGCMRVG